MENREIPILHRPSDLRPMSRPLEQTLFVYPENSGINTKIHSLCPPCLPVGRCDPVVNVEPHGLKPVPPPHASEGRNPPKHTLLRSSRASKGTLSAFIHGLRDRGFLRRRAKDFPTEDGALSLPRPGLQAPGQGP